MPPAAASGSPDGAPPQDNPILTAYEKFVADTPVVTRTILNVLVVSYILSYIVDLKFAMACIPEFMLRYYEIYRLVTPVFVNQTLFSVLFAGLSFVQTGKLLEESLGSAAMAWLCLVVFTLATNTLFVALYILGFYMTGDSSMLLSSSSGMWVILFGLISMECCHAAQYQPKRRLFFFEVPTIYYPPALLALFSLFSGHFQLSYAISVALGYGLGNGKLEVLKARPTHVKALEESTMFLNSRLRQQGWVGVPAARGSAAWSQAEPDDGTQVGPASIFFTSCSIVLQTRIFLTYFRLALP